jgi:hypothetical protein
MGISDVASFISQKKKKKCSSVFGIQGFVVHPNMFYFVLNEAQVANIHYCRKYVVNNSTNACKKYMKRNINVKVNL